LDNISIEVTKRSVTAMRKKNILFTALILFLSTAIFFNVFAQNSYFPGIIIKSEGDTLSCFIRYNNSEVNPTKVSFKTIQNGDVYTLSFNQIREYHVLDEIYVSAIVDTEISPSKINYLTFDQSLQIEVDTVLLQVIVRGDKSLYYYRNSNGNENLFIGDNDQFILLKYKKYLSQGVTTNEIKEDKTFKIQLMSYLFDCPNIGEYTSNIGYSKSSIEKLFLRYYDCTSSNIIFRKETEKFTSQFGALAGLSIATLNFEGKHEVFYMLIDGIYDPSYNFSVGVFFEAIAPRNNGKLSFNNELIYSSYKVNGFFNDYKNEAYYTKRYSTIGYSYVKMNNMIRFKYPVGNVEPFVNLGFSNGIAINETNESRNEGQFYGETVFETTKAIGETRKYEQGILFGGGVKVSRLSIEMRLEKGNGMVNYNALKATSTRLYSFVGYRF
tara:strand:+ start:3656 stop:4975 length:1320 start_codon:yes stop_codon:yes gene_type:complete